VSEDTTAQPPRRVSVTPIVLRDTPRWRSVNHKFISLGIKFERTVAVDAGIRIIPKSEDDYHRTIPLFREEEVPHHTFPLLSERNIHAVIRGVPATLSETETKGELQQRRCSPLHIIRLKHGGGVPMPLVVVILSKIEKSQQLFNEHELLGLAVRVEDALEFDNSSPSQSALSWGKQLQKPLSGPLTFKDSDNCEEKDKQSQSNSTHANIIAELSAKRLCNSPRSDVLRTDQHSLADAKFSGYTYTFGGIHNSHRVNNEEYQVGTKLRTEGQAANLHTRIWMDRPKNLQQSDKCRYGCQDSETIQHVTGGCQAFAPTDYKERHDIAAKFIHQELAYKFKLIECKLQYYKYTSQCVFENDNKNRESNNGKGWKDRIKANIQNLRKDLSRLSELGCVTNVRNRKMNSLIRAYKIQSIEDLETEKGELKQKISAKAQRLRRYTERQQQYSANMRFETDTKGFYRNITQEQIELVQLPSKDRVQHFWKALWEH
ncbi:unnamed protein product, partial [Acanthoscelides obtectus]